MKTRNKTPKKSSLPSEIHSRRRRPPPKNSKSTVPATSRNSKYLGLAWAVMDLVASRTFCCRWKWMLGIFHWLVLHTYFYGTVFPKMDSWSTVNKTSSSSYSSNPLNSVRNVDQNNHRPARFFSDNSTTDSNLYGNLSVHTCLMNDDCLLETAKRIARVWKKKHLDWTCHHHHPPSQKNQSLSPLLLKLIKVPKSASSTMAGLVLRIAHRHDTCFSNNNDNDNNKNNYNNQSLLLSSSSSRRRVEWEHGSAQEFNVTQTRRRTSSSSSSMLLIAPIRNPQQRALSDVYFHRVSLQPRQKGTKQQDRQRQPSDAFIIKGLQQIPSNYITQYTHLPTEKHQPIHFTNDNSIATVENILQTYDFLFLVEEMELSLVVFAWLAGLNMADVMVSNSKLSSSWYSPKKNKCVRLIPPVATDGIHKFWNSQAWKRQHSLDRLLHLATRLSLYQTVQVLEQEFRYNISQAVTNLKNWQQKLQWSCANETFPPCNNINGTYQAELAKSSCYERDFGCGYPCYDRILDDNNNNLTQNSTTTLSWGW